MALKCLLLPVCDRHDFWGPHEQAEVPPKEQIPNATVWLANRALGRWVVALLSQALRVGGVLAQNRRRLSLVVADDRRSYDEWLRYWSARGSGH